MLTGIQKKILEFLQNDLPVESSPYSALSKKLKIDEDRIAREIIILKNAGYIRRIGGILNHYRIGLKKNCMCVWKVPESIITQMTEISVNKQQVSHCYLRRACMKWPYNFYTMIHGCSKKDCIEVIKGISSESGIKDYKMLFTKKELKKISLKYKV
ncbi:MAG: Lrp/AsnC family transcriptional regulator [bacterium]